MIFLPPASGKLCEAFLGAGNTKGGVKAVTKKQKTNLIRIIVSAVLVAGIWLSPLTGWLEGVL